MHGRKTLGDGRRARSLRTRHARERSKIMILWITFFARGPGEEAIDRRIAAEHISRSISLSSVHRSGDRSIEPGPEADLMLSPVSNMVHTV